MLAVMCAGVVCGQSQKQKVAVYVTGEIEGAPQKIMTTKLVSAISKDRRYSAIERTDAFLAALDKEQNYQHSGKVDEAQIAAIGKQFGADLVCVATVTAVADAWFVEARLVDLVTNAIVVTTDLHRTVGSVDDYVELAEDLAAKLMDTSEDDNKMKTVGALVVLKKDLAANVGYEEAEALCSQSRTGGYDDWQLPTVAEFKELKRNESSLGASRYWVSGGVKKCMSTRGNDVYSCDKAAVRCVRTNEN
jgi:hypothetical protein